jgi:7-carboxy-7-deazaguanine synthase
MTGEDIALYITRCWPFASWVLVTGGEPARYDLSDLVNQLHKADYRVALETSGTETGHVGVAFDWVCVSPKFQINTLKRKAIAVANEIKMVVGRPTDLDAFVALLDDMPRRFDTRISVQPLSQSEKATELCIDAVQQYDGWTLSVQTHKFIGVP